MRQIVGNSLRLQARTVNLRIERGFDLLAMNTLNALALLTGTPILVGAAVLDAVAAMPERTREVEPETYEGPGEMVASLMGSLPPSQPR